MHRQDVTSFEWTDARESRVEHEEGGRSIDAVACHGLDRTSALVAIATEHRVRVYVCEDARIQETSLVHDSEDDHESTVTAVAFHEGGSGDEKLRTISMCTASRDSIRLSRFVAHANNTIHDDDVRILDTEDTKIRIRLRATRCLSSDHHREIRRVKWGTTSDTVVIAMAGRVFVLSTQTGTIRYSVPQRVDDFAIGLDNAVLATMDASGLCLWTLRDGRTESRQTVSFRRRLACVESGEGGLFAAGDVFGYVHVYLVSTADDDDDGDNKTFAHMQPVRKFDFCRLLSRRGLTTFDEDEEEEDYDSDDSTTSLEENEDSDAPRRYNKRRAQLSFLSIRFARRASTTSRLPSLTIVSNRGAATLFLQDMTMRYHGVSRASSSLFNAFESTVSCVSRGVATAAACVVTRCDRAEDERVSLLFLSLRSTGIAQDAKADERSCSIWSRDEPLPGSPLLRARLKAPETTEGTKSAKPVTFRTRIASSGYGKTIPYRRLKDLRKGGRSARRGASERRRRRRSGGEEEEDAYPRLDDATTAYAKCVILSSTSSTILSCMFSPTGSSIACAATDGVVRIERVKRKRKGQEHTSTVLRGHDEAVNAIGWSTDALQIVSASADGTAKLWRLSTKRSDAAALTMRPKDVSKKIGVLHASFYYQDRFVLVGSGATLSLFDYWLQPLRERNDLERLRNRNYAVCAHRWRHAKAKTLTAVSNANGVLSPIAIVAGSDRSLSVYDFAASRTAREIHDAHSRPSHAVSFPTFSRFVRDIPQASFDTFATAAVDGNVKLWDLRAAKCASVFSAHTNTTERVGVAISPDLRFVAVGCESREFCVYDARTLKCVSRGKRGATGRGVAFSPRRPLLAAGSESRLSFWGVS